MMVDLADRVIQANKDEEKAVKRDSRDKWAEEYEARFDDIGFPYPRRRTTHSMCEYLTARVLYLNPYIYQYDGRLWLNDEPIVEDLDSYYKLARYPEDITKPQCRYVWTRLRDIVPALNKDIIAVLPNMTFNMRTGKLERESVRTTTPWHEDDNKKEMLKAIRKNIEDSRKWY